MGVPSPGSAATGSGSVTPVEVPGAGDDTGAPSIFVKNFADSPVELRANSFTGAVTPYSGPSQSGPSGRNNAP